MFQLLLAVDTLHGQNMFHLDLKPENVLVKANGKILLSDFGFSRLAPYRQEKKPSRVGSTWYRAPELIRGEKM